MKKLLLMVFGATLMAVPATHAQVISKSATQVMSSDASESGPSKRRVNIEKLRSEITKSANAIADPKKNTKAANWLKYGETLVDAESKLTEGLFAGFDETLLLVGWGKTVPQQSTIGNLLYRVYPYEHVKVYVADNQVRFYLPTTVIVPDALDKAYDALAKAYEMDGKTAEKVKDAMERIRVRSLDNAAAYFALDEYKESGDNFRRAYRVGSHPAMNRVDTIALFYAGIAAISGEDYETGIRDLDKVLEMGYETGGEAHRLKFLALYNQDRKEESLAVLKEGIASYPGNADLLDMAMRYYAENDGDPSEMIPLVEKAIANNPTDVNLHQGLARVFDKLGRPDDAIKAIRRAVALDPDNFVSNYLEGLFLTKKGDQMTDDMRNVRITSREQSDKLNAAILAMYAQALPPLEKAFSIDSTQLAAVQLLKELTFRLRDEPGMNEKYETYDALFKSMQAAGAQ